MFMSVKVHVKKRALQVRKREKEKEREGKGSTTHICGRGMSQHRRASAHCTTMDGLVGMLIGYILLESLTVNPTLPEVDTATRTA